MSTFCSENCVLTNHWVKSFFMVTWRYIFYEYLQIPLAPYCPIIKKMCKSMFWKIKFSTKLWYFQKGLEECNLSIYLSSYVPLVIQCCNCGSLSTVWKFTYHLFYEKMRQFCNICLTKLVMSWAGWGIILRQTQMKYSSIFYPNSLPNNLVLLILHSDTTFWPLTL